MVQGTTPVFGIFGHPVAHSLSPAMQNAAFRESGIEGIYVPFHVLPENLEPAVAALVPMGISGINVTVPHKEAVLPLLDDVEPRAGAIGAVNTVVVREGRLVGYNTDWLGFLSSLDLDLGTHPEGKKVLMLGAGGASRAGLVALAERGASEITVANRTLAKAESLVKDFAVLYPDTRWSSIPLEEAMLRGVAPQVDLIVSSLSAGLHSDQILPFPWEEVSASACFFDMLYSPTVTPMVQQARNQGLVACDGMGMLAGQGEEAFRIWTGTPAPVGLMRRILERCRTVD